MHIIKSMKKFFLAVLLLTTLSFSREVPFTQEDRDRLIRLEEGQKALQKQVDNLQTFMLWGFGILFSGMGILIGLVMWDRRTAIAPIKI
jgi:hypothetical protein